MILGTTVEEVVARLTSKNRAQRLAFLRLRQERQCKDSLRSSGAFALALEVAVLQHIEREQATYIRWVNSRRWLTRRAKLNLAEVARHNDGKLFPLHYAKEETKNDWG